MLITLYTIYICAYLYSEFFYIQIFVDRQIIIIDMCCISIQYRNLHRTNTPSIVSIFV